MAEDGPDRPKSHLTVKLLFVLLVLAVFASAIIVINLPQIKERLSPESKSGSRSEKSEPQKEVLLNDEPLTSIVEDENNENLYNSLEREALEPGHDFRPLSEQCFEKFPELKPDKPIGGLPPAESVIVETTSGKLRGLRSHLFGKEVNTFLGFPFAEAPVNGLRFRKTVPVKPWHGIKNATALGPHCPQKIPSLLLRNLNLLTTEFAEDCLFMNIWTPSVRDTQKEETELRPVLFYVHGGGFDVGRVGTDENDGRVLAVVGDAVVVTFNYRLGTLGWLDLDIEECPGNQGLYDIATAIKWVKENARAFGGDPEKMTLFGQSAGGLCIGFLMVSPVYNHLVTSAIFQSAPPIFPNLLYTYTEGAAAGVAKHVGCDFSEEDPDTVYNDPDKVLECLLKLPPAAFEKHLNGTNFGLNYFHFPLRNNDFPFTPYDGMQNGSYILSNLKRIIIGTNKNEGTIFLPTLLPDMFPLDGNMKLPNITSAIQFANYVTELAVAKIPQLKPRYPQIRSAIYFLVGKEPEVDTPQNLLFRAIDKATRLAAICPSKILSDRLTELGKTAYMYHFTQRSSWTRWPSWMGVSHGDELHFVFGHPLRYPNVYSGDDIDLSKRMMKSWANFARNGSPVPQMDVEWTPYTVDKKEYMELNGKTAFMGSEDDSKLCEFYHLAFALSE